MHVVFSRMHVCSKEPTIRYYTALEHKCGEYASKRATKGSNVRIIGMIFSMIFVTQQDEY